MSIVNESSNRESYDWTMIVQEYGRRQRQRVRNIVQPTTIPTPNRRLSGWEDAPKGRYLVLRNVDGT